MPDAEEEEPEDDLEEEVVATSSSEDEEEDAIAEDENGRPFTPELNIVELQHDQTPAPSARGRFTSQTHIRTPGAKLKAPIHITRGGGMSAKAVGATPLHSRGITDFNKLLGGNEPRIKHLFGSTDDAFKRIFSTRDHWAAQETLPLRRPGSQRRSFFYDTSTQEKEQATTEKWYAEVGQEAFAKAQKSRNLTAEEAAVYLANEGTDSINVLCGPLDEPQIFTLKKFSYISTAQPFKEKENRRGWLFHLGSRVQDAQWAPKEEGDVQYLAVAVEQKLTGRAAPKPLGNPKAPAFTASKPFPASIQIWAFDADEDGRLDVSKQPRLALVICTDWGAPRQFRWSPVRTVPEHTTKETQKDEHIGMLAGIWSDGRVRILDITVPGSEETSTGTQYVHYSQAAFDVSIPQTVPSCVKWLSGTTLGVATAIGALAIWTLSRPSTFSSPGPKPWFYQQLSDTYIVTLSSGWPSQPQFISITTADGFAKLYDIRTPNADNVASIRGRTICVTQDWHEHTQSFVGPDEYYMLKHNPVRRYYHNLYTMRADSMITRCATSPVHPGILIGGADGKVETSNPLGRITNYKAIPWQQTWFMHEWRRPVKELNVETTEDTPMAEGGPMGGGSASTDSDTATTAQKGSVPREFLDKPLVRILEGYKASQPGIQHSVTSKKQKNPEVGKGLTIYEEPSAITALGWNPNVKFGTWAVAGMGDGLLRVEDVGI